jgi:hypothetical protein
MTFNNFIFLFQGLEVSEVDLEVLEVEDLVVAKEEGLEVAGSEAVVVSTLPSMLELALDSELSWVPNSEDLLVQALAEALEVSLVPKSDRVDLAVDRFQKRLNRTNLSKNQK